MVYSGVGDIDIVNVHVPNGSENGWDKIETLEGIACVIRSAPDGLRILAGDFNEPMLIRPNGEIITSGQQIAIDGSVRLGRRSKGKAGPGQFRDAQGRTDDLQRWDQGVRGIFEGEERLRLSHVRHLMPGHPLMPVTHRTRRSDRFFDHVFLSRHFRVSKVEYIHHVREAGYSDHSPVYVEIHCDRPA
jgi:endonuclease/exonuclease/phosphatase family metal-dependent hydrolase